MKTTLEPREELQEMTKVDINKGPEGTNRDQEKPTGDKRDLEGARETKRMQNHGTKLDLTRFFFLSGQFHPRTFAEINTI